MSLQQAFLDKHQLPQAYWELAEKWFAPLIPILLKHHNGAKPFFLGINGCQGSGKSTLADFLAEHLRQHGLKVCVISLDDFYLSKARREQLANDIHPLLKTRGVPGTHDLLQAIQVFQQLYAGQACAVPRFNKAEDDLYPPTQWQLISSPQDIIIFEGWCVASQVMHDDLREPLNDLERQADPDSVWRQYVNSALKLYQPWFAFIDYLIMLKAPSFDQVYAWRLEQEQKLLATLKAQQMTASSVMNEAQIGHFIAHYQRVTEANLQHLPTTADIVFTLDNNRQIVEQHIKERARD